MENKIRVFIVEDDPFALKLDVALLTKEDDIEVVGSATNKDDAIRLAVELKPDVVLADINLTNKEDQFGIEVAIALSIKIPETKVVMLSGILNEDTVRSTIGLDVAHNYLLKDKPERIPQTIRDSYNDVRSMDSAVVEFIARDYKEALKTTMKLTKQHITILELFYRDYSVEEVADALSLEVQSVRNHQQAISKRCLGWKWRIKRLSAKELANRAKVMGLF